MTAPAAADPLPLQDVHLPPAPSWWPPAPGWWLLIGVALLALAVYGWRRRRARLRRRASARFFDETVDAADSASARIAMMSELLRRAARRCEPGAERLTGAAWLAFLDAGQRIPAFSAGVGRALLEGGFRRDAGEDEVLALRTVVRERFVELMERGIARERPRPGWWPRRGGAR